MQTFRTSAYIVKIGGFWDRMKNREGLPQGDGPNPWTPKDMAGSFGGEPSDDGMTPVPSKDTDVSPMSPDDLRDSYGGEPEGSLGDNPQLGQKTIAPAGPNVTEKRSLLHSALKKLMQGTGVDIFSAAPQVANNHSELFSDDKVASWYAKFIASQIGEEIDGNFYLKHDDPIFEDEFEEMKAQLPQNVQQHLDTITGRGGL